MNPGFPRLPLGPNLYDCTCDLQSSPTATLNPSSGPPCVSKACFHVTSVRRPAWRGKFTSPFSQCRMSFPGCATRTDVTWDANLPHANGVCGAEGPRASTFVFRVARSPRLEKVNALAQARFSFINFLPNSGAFSLQSPQLDAPQTLRRWQVWSFSSVHRGLECLITSER